ncbi:MAG: hypothetical protein LQ343_007047 [Gyalolechia ehrenbergii]|nr:MAG: hypothetical protein LQ343_007047 [Gyalolechia ehrenbergii]
MGYDRNGELFFPASPSRPHHRHANLPGNLQPQYYAGPNPIQYQTGHSLYNNPFSQNAADPLTHYALPTGRPPLAGRNRYREFERRRPTRLFSHARIDSQDGDSDHTRKYYDSLTDVESDISDAVSGDSFTFDCSVSEPSEQHTEDTAGSSIPSNGATHILDASKPEKPSPYASADLCVWQSRFVGEPLQQWDGPAFLSASKIPIKPKQQAPGLFKWMCVTKVTLSHESNMTTWRPPMRYSEGKEPGRVHFLCLPYFTLNSYAAHQYSNTSDAHPTRSLLQTQYPSAAMGREMQQAVCHLQTSDQRICYHVPQLWCLYVENKLLVTCSRFSMDETQQGIANVDMVKSPTNLSTTQILHVSDRSGRTWLIPISECSTWLDFVSHFSALTSDFESDYNVVYSGVVQKPENWQRLVALTKKQILRVILYARCKSRSRSRDTESANSSSEEDSPDPARSESPTVVGSNPTVGPNQIDLKSQTTDTERKKGSTTLFDTDTTYNMRSSDLANATRASTQDVWVEDFHLFYWLAAVSKVSRDASRLTTAEENENIRTKGIPVTIDNQQLNSRMSQMQKYLTRKSRVGRRAYAQCPRSGLDKVDARKAVIDRLAKGNDERGDTSSRRRARGMSDVEAPRRDLENLEGRSSSEEARSRSSRRSPSNQIALKDFDFYHLRGLRRLTSLMQSLARLLRQGPPPGMINLPIELSRAWIHLLTFWVLATTKRSTRALEAELDKCHGLLESGRVKVLRMRASNPLYHYEAVVPSGIVALLVNKLAGDVVSGSSDIEATYYSFVTKLEQEVQQKPYSRGHQEKITAVRQEINCVLAVLQDQSTSIDKFRSTVMRRKIDVRPRFPQRREAYILQNCLLSISDRMQNFRELDERARGIAAFNLYRIESNRDRQEGAILVFTIVTIIFLPLSFVSSFFGMNTSDIRDMTTPQWAFWASAVPLTAIVVGVSIFVARKIEPVKDWWSGFAHRWGVRPGNVAAGDVFPAPGMVMQQPVQRMASGFPHQRPGQSYTWEESGRPRRRQTGGLQYQEYDA